MNSKIELIASYWTLAGAALPHSAAEWSTFEFKERVQAAAREGFKGIGLWHSDLEHTLETRSLKEMKRILDDNGMQHLELEVLEDWFVDGERRQKAEVRKKLLFDAALKLSVVLLPAASCQNLSIRILPAKCSNQFPAPPGIAQIIEPEFKKRVAVLVFAFGRAAQL